MRDEEHGAIEVRERLDEHFLREEVQVIGGLVEDQEVRWVEQHSRNHQPRLLAAGERPNLLVDIVARELKRAGQVPQHADRFIREVALQLLFDRQIRIEQVERLLCEVAHLEARAQPDLAGVRSKHAGNHSQQRGLPRPVSAHHAPALAAPDRHAEPVVDDAVSVRLRNVLEHGNLIARPWRLAEIEPNDTPFLGQLDLFDLLERLDTALDLRRFGGMGREALDEALLLGQHRLLPRVRSFAIGFPDRALALVEVVVARIDRDLAAVDLRDLGDDAIHELAVVRRHEQRTGSRLQIGLEPDDRFDVEMVGRLVHQQDVGRAEEDAGHRHAHLPPTREQPHIAIDPLVVETESVKNFPRLRLETVTAQVLVFLLHLAEPGQNAVHVVRFRGIGHVVLQRFELMVEDAEPAAAGNRLVEHRPPRHLLDVLPEVADGDLLRHRHVALVGRFLADDHPKERRLSGAVRPDQPDLLSRVQLEGCIDEQNLPAVLLADT